MVDQTGKEDVDLEYTVDLQQLCSNLEGDIKEQDEVCESQEDDEQNGTHTAENFKLDVGVIARQISRDIWDKTKFRFMWVSEAEKAKPKVHEDIRKRRARDTMIWDYILKQDPETELTEKQVQTEWMRINKDHWRLDQDQVTLASKLLESFDQEKVEIIPITQRKGSSSIAFAFTKILDGIGSDIEEVLMDSTYTASRL
ncbi:hypothetical protein C8R42DRAFT_643879 [Lentinula raphanica]|nr:hypothetical protein C8R42DRAFT_643879 [Lentinula raphanica]